MNVNGDTQFAIANSTATATKNFVRAFDSNFGPQQLRGTRHKIVYTVAGHAPTQWFELRMQNQTDSRLREILAYGFQFTNESILS